MYSDLAVRLKLYFLRYAWRHEFPFYRLPEAFSTEWLVVRKLNLWFVVNMERTLLRFLGRAKRAKCHEI